MIDIMPMVKVLKTIYGTCDTCQIKGDIKILKTYQCLRLFFIPIFKWQTRYFMQHSCGGQTELTEEIALGLLHGTISVDNLHMSHDLLNPNICKKCGKMLETGFEFCPYCGSQR